MKTAKTHRETLHDYDRKRALLLEGDTVVFNEENTHYLQVSVIYKSGRRWVIEGGMIENGIACDCTVYASDVTKAIKQGATVLRDA